MNKWKSAKGDQATPSAMVAALGRMQGTKDIRDKLKKYGFD